ncbi:hypothetical protein ACFQFC_01530 [Amorphoplanes digitatis]|uniref:Uncharacterized protein n=1 Tax=Actinoplanes digitatis TaxID=1868 RepID=A0A7W7HY76_9ACTN|nr:hypothetical protein [Actinoplanes digitatis]MBB4762858.1 hypothetical protein [Actinoplanes digitatis]BFE71795.1 hypothetical protein GCM10020092_050960 [Actinoplanes digitatis]GID91647.1 hypothetical protein Adi01nite_10590 [Actinoplanes digitatis]
MRRAAVIAGSVLAALWIASPAQAFAHNAVHNANLHALLDGLTLLVASAPIWTAVLWRGSRAWLLAALIAVVQVPVAVIGFVPIVDPALHLTLFGLALALTGFSLWLVRRSPATATAPAPDRS